MNQQQIDPFPDFMDGALARKATTPRRAVKYRCLYCAGTWSAVGACDCYDCDLYYQGVARRAEKLRKSREDRQNASLPLETGAGAVLVTKGQLRCREQAKAQDAKPTATLAIRRHCMWCMGGSRDMVELCVEPSCPLFAWRYGKRPATAAKEGKSVHPKMVLSRGVLLLAEVPE
jgi:hypothetical protein